MYDGFAAPGKHTLAVRVECGATGEDRVAYGAEGVLRRRRRREQAVERRLRRRRNRRRARPRSPRSAKARSTCACARISKRWSGRNEARAPLVHVRVVDGAGQAGAGGGRVPAGDGAARARRQDGGDAEDAGRRGAPRRRRIGRGAAGGRGGAPVRDRRRAALSRLLRQRRLSGRRVSVGPGAGARRRHDDGAALFVRSLATRTEGALLPRRAARLRRRLPRSAHRRVVRRRDRQARRRGRQRGARLSARARALRRQPLRARRAGAVAGDAEVALLLVGAVPARRHARQTAGSARRRGRVLRHRRRQGGRSHPLLHRRALLRAQGSGAAGARTHRARRRSRRRRLLSLLPRAVGLEEARRCAVRGRPGRRLRTRTSISARGSSRSS